MTKLFLNVPLLLDIATMPETEDVISLFPMLGILGGLLILLALGMLMAIIAVVLILVAYNRKEKREAGNKRNDAAGER